MASLQKNINILNMVRKIIYRVTLVISFLLTVFYMQSCQLIYPAEGDIVINETLIGEVKSLIINDVFNVYITPDSTNLITIECGENQARTIKILYDSISRKLTLANTAKIIATQGYRPINVYLHVNSLAEIEITEAARVYFTDTMHVSNFLFSHHGDMGDSDLKLNAENIEIKIYDSGGKYMFSGNANYLYIFNRGLATINATELLAIKVKCNQVSNGHCHLSAQKELRWKIYMNGNIYQNGIIEHIEGESYGKGKLYINQ